MKMDALWCKRLPGIKKIVGSNPCGGQDFSHGKLSKILSFFISINNLINKQIFNIIFKKYILINL